MNLFDKLKSFFKKVTFQTDHYASDMYGLGDLTKIYNLISNSNNMNRKVNDYLQIQISLNNKLINSAIKGDLSELIMSIKNGATKNYQDKNGCTAAHYAALNNNDDCLSYLIKIESAMDIKNNEGMTVNNILEKLKAEQESNTLESLIMENNDTDNNFRF